MLACLCEAYAAYEMNTPGVQDHLRMTHPRLRTRAKKHAISARYDRVGTPVQFEKCNISRDNVWVYIQVNSLSFCVISDPMTEIVLTLFCILETL